MSDFYSYHIFYFPFRWEVPGLEDKLFSEQVNMDNIPILPYSMWQRVQIDEDSTKQYSENIEEEMELFAERQYYFDFVHNALYDVKGDSNNIVRHYERKDVKNGNVRYYINVKDKSYELKVDALNLNIYSTGVGVMSFYLKNEKENQSDEKSIRDINQFGRHIMPPYCGEFDPNNRSMLAESIVIEGLVGDAGRYTDKFDYTTTKGSATQRGLYNIWEPARFIKNLIADFSSSLKVVPVIDDRMMVNCWYGNNELSGKIKNELYSEKDKTDKINYELENDFLYKYVFVDNGNDLTCQNKAMKYDLLQKALYMRWQKYGTMYGVSRYSFVALTDGESFAKNVLSMHVRTIYSRMLELVIIQRASILRFSGEVARVSALKGKDDKEMAKRISSLYKEYIRFVNQVYFRSVTAQDQGIELYDMLLKQFDTNAQIKDLDNEIGELHQYATLLIDQRRNETAEWLNWVAAILLPATLMTGIFGMNQVCEKSLPMSFAIEISIIVAISLLMYFLLLKRKRR